MNKTYTLRKLSTSDGEKFYELLRHIGSNENDFTNPVHDMNYDEFKIWLKQQDDWSKGELLPEGYVPQICYWLMLDNIPVGFGKIRLGLTPQSRKEGGNIGCAIDSRYRGKGFGTKFIELLIAKAKELKVLEILITVKKYNYASKLMVENNGGKVFRETDEWWYLTF